MKKERILVVSSCTRQKGRKNEPAWSLYRGRQHVLTADAVSVLIGDELTCVEWHVLTADRGLVHCDEEVSPHDSTFSKLSAHRLRRAAESFDFPRRYLDLAVQFDCVFNVLGETYVRSLCLPPLLPRGPVYVFMGGGSMRRIVPRQDGVVVLSAAEREARKYHEAVSATKGALLLDLVEAVVGSEPRRSFVSWLPSSGISGITEWSGVAAPSHCCVAPRGVGVRAGEDQEGQ